MSTRILQLSDIHFGSEDAGAIQACQEAAKGYGADVTVICGDITQHGRREEFEQANRWISSLPGPKIVTPGNHDTPMFNVLARLTQPFKDYMALIAPLGHERFANEDVEIIGLNSARGAQWSLDWSTGVISTKQRQNAPAAFTSRTGERLRWVACHHPLKYPVISPLQKKTKGGPAAISHWAKSKIDAVLSGHVHVPFAIERNVERGDLTSIGSGTLSTRRRDKPASYNIIDIDHKHIDISAVQWTGDAYERVRIKRISR